VKGILDDYGISSKDSGKVRNSKIFGTMLEANNRLITQVEKNKALFKEGSAKDMRSVRTKYADAMKIGDSTASLKSVIDAAEASGDEIDASLMSISSSTRSKAKKKKK